MAKIVSSASGPIPPDPGDPAPRPILERKEVVVTPNPKTKAQREGNAKAQRLADAVMREEQNAHAPSKLTPTQKTRRRKLKRDEYYKAVEAALAAGFRPTKHLLRLSSFLTSTTLPGISKLRSVRSIGGRRRAYSPL
jgi:hypothetical protein